MQIPGEPILCPDCSGETRPVLIDVDYSFTLGKVKFEASGRKCSVCGFKFFDDVQTPLVALRVDDERGSLVLAAAR